MKAFFFFPSECSEILKYNDFLCVLVQLKTNFKKCFCRLSDHSEHSFLCVCTQQVTQGTESSFNNIFIAYLLV